MNYNDCFINAVGNNDVEDLIFLLKEKRVNPSILNNIAIQEASLYGYRKIIKILLNDKRVDPTIYSNIPLRVKKNLRQ